MKTINLKNFKALVFTIAACYFSVSALAQNQVATPSPINAMENDSGLNKIEN